ncbi:MAG: HAMP domain-containing protein [Clostridiales Family XIII bacterium]|nr:HAMP domain-containing protein [Clostridiales Family XIII bacterium]
MRSLKAQLSLSFIAVVLITVSLFSLFSFRLIDRQFSAYMENQQRSKTGSIVDNLGLQYDAATGEWNIDSVYALGMLSLSDGYIIKVYDAAGEILWDAENHEMEQCEHLMASITRRMEEHGASGDFIVRDFLLTRDGKKIGSVGISYFGPYFLSENDFGFINSLYYLLIIVCVTSLLLSFGAGVMLARRISRPVAKTADIATQIAAGNYDIRFESETKTTELYNLVSSINHLADALDAQKKLQRQLTADVAHELRTPLATLGTHLEAMIEGVWEATPERLVSCHEEIQRLGKMVVDLERLERAESDNLQLDKAPADLFALAHSVCDNFAGELTNKNLRLDIEGEHVNVMIDKDRIRGVISNLMSNAVKYTPEGGRIKISVENAENAGNLVVEDNGEGIEASKLPFIFERFYRADTSRSRGTGGTGIGLAIVKSVVSAHGGSVDVQSKPDEGSRFTVTLPKAL